MADEFRLFEKLCLEGFQAGLSWLTILKKRENFREAFAGFNFYKIAEYGEGVADVRSCVIPSTISQIGPVTTDVAEQAV